MIELLISAAPNRPMNEAGGFIHVLKKKTTKKNPSNKPKAEQISLQCGTFGLFSPPDIKFFPNGFINVIWKSQFFTIRCRKSLFNYFSRLSVICSQLFSFNFYYFIFKILISSFIFFHFFPFFLLTFPFFSLFIPSPSILFFLNHFSSLSRFWIFSPFFLTSNCFSFLLHFWNYFSSLSHF